MLAGISSICHDKHQLNTTNNSEFHLSLPVQYAKERGVPCAGGAQGAGAKGVAAASVEARAAAGISRGWRIARGGCVACCCRDRRRVEGVGVEGRGRDGAGGRSHRAWSTVQSGEGGSADGKYGRATTQTNVAIKNYLTFILFSCTGDKMKSRTVLRRKKSRQRRLHDSI
jgi:hypothetical protein